MECSQDLSVWGKKKNEDFLKNMIKSGARVIASVFDSFEHEWLFLLVCHYWVGNASVKTKWQDSTEYKRWLQ